MQIGPKPSSASICGSCVVLPHPVSPSTMSTGLERSSCRICSRYAWIGRPDSLRDGGAAMAEGVTVADG